jgi:hypothetical protein
MPTAATLSVEEAFKARSGREWKRPHKDSQGRECDGRPIRTQERIFDVMEHYVTVFGRTICSGCDYGGE